MRLAVTAAQVVVLMTGAGCSFDASGVQSRDADDTSPADASRGGGGGGGRIVIRACEVDIDDEDGAAVVSPQPREPARPRCP